MLTFIIWTWQGGFASKKGSRTAPGKVSVYRYNLDQAVKICQDKLLQNSAIDKVNT
jgi:hypothetical protein